MDARLNEEKFVPVSSDLYSCLDALIEIYRDFLSLVEQERFHLLKSEISQLSELNKKKENLVRRARSAERTRVALMAELAKNCGATVDLVRLSDLEGRLSKSDFLHLKNRQALLKELISSVLEFNRRNEALTNNALKSIRGAMKVLKGDLGARPTYQRHGEVSSEVRSGQLVSREA